ncbi:MAG: ribosome biogenesis/translation initiation ATPase RLI [Nanoarchaeota archaeon]
MRKVAVIVERQKCYPNKCQHECMKYDPVNKAGGEGFHLSPIHGKSEINEEVASEMHKICAKKCPFQAIHIVNLPEKLKEDPINRFGQNQFELYSLPIIKPNLTVGVIGKNGIGKSTALEILSGNVIPNLGEFNSKPEYSKIIHKYSTRSFGDYFKRLSNKELKISYKPQRVEMLATLYKGHKVIDLLKKVDEKNKIDFVMKELELENLKDHMIEELSGGELQRTAIAACLLKEADVYYFDEPTSFLDITHRIKAARIIRHLAENHSVVVVEHDLATLDYISDEIQIVYGEPACYGIFSQSKAVRRGINEYMDGYLPDENIRFRNYPIKFFERPLDTILSKTILAEFPLLEKKFEIFNLKVNEVKLHKGEVLTIMGSNGLGKSTFLKMISGVLKPDNIDIKNLKISYKPQYLEFNIDGSVESYLRSIAGTEFDSGWYKTNILEKLNVQNILNNEIKKLSGGELQKMHIVACLTNPSAELIAMDEPSAFIDVEDRLKVAEIIRDYVMMKDIAAIVVDHDIQFIDYLADSMIIFEGIPTKEGHVFGPLTKRDGMNRVLKNLDITYRRDKQTGRPRINKPGSQLDQEQRRKGEYYYT